MVSSCTRHTSSNSTHQTCLSCSARALASAGAQRPLPRLTRAWISWACSMRPLRGARGPASSRKHRSTSLGEWRHGGSASMTSANSSRSISPEPSASASRMTSEISSGDTSTPTSAKSSSSSSSSISPDPSVSTRLNRASTSSRWALVIVFVVCVVAVSCVSCERSSAIFATAVCRALGLLLCALLGPSPRYLMQRNGESSGALVSRGRGEPLDNLGPNSFA